MKNMVRYGWLGLMLAVGWAGAAVAQPAEEAVGGIHVQLFGTVDRTVMGVGVAFFYQVEVYASPATPQEALRVEQAVAAGTFAEVLGGIEVIREEPVDQPRREPDEPLVLRRQFLLKANRPGALRLPAFSIQLDEHTYSTLPLSLQAYEAGPSVFEAQASVFPLVAEVHDQGRTFIRTGSGFLIAPDAVVTSLHVVIDARRVVLTLPDGRRLATRKVWAVDPVRDVAVLYVKPRQTARVDLRPLDLAPVRGAVTKDYEDASSAIVFTLGWPGGVQQSTAGVQYGGLTLEPGEPLWISTNPVRPGDSGGPLLDQHGQVLGVISSGTKGHSWHARPQPHEDISIATDLRPVLGLKMVAQRPRSLARLMRNAGFNADPYVQALRVATYLMTGRRSPNLETALAALKTEAHQDIDSAQLHLMRGVIYQLLGTSHSAADAYRASLDVHGGQFIAAYMLGMHHLRQRAYDKAEHLFRQTMAYEPYTYLARYGLARALMGRQRYAEAVPLLRHVITRDPTYVPALYHLAQCHLALGDEPRARQLLVKLKAVSPAGARQFRRVLAQPLLRPPVVREQPRAVMPALTTPQKGHI